MDLSIDRWSKVYFKDCYNYDQCLVDRKMDPLTAPLLKLQRLEGYRSLTTTVANYIIYSVQFCTIANDVDVYKN